MFWADKQPPRVSGIVNQIGTCYLLFSLRKHVCFFLEILSRIEVKHGMPMHKDFVNRNKIQREKESGTTKREEMKPFFFCFDHRLLKLKCDYSFLNLNKVCRLLHCKSVCHLIIICPFSYHKDMNSKFE